MAKTRVNTVHPRTSKPAVAMVIDEQGDYLRVQFADGTLLTVHRHAVTFF